MLTEAATVNGKVDYLAGLKENVIVGRLIPAGTGSVMNRHARSSPRSVTRAACLRLRRPCRNPAGGGRDAARVLIASPSRGRAIRRGRRPLCPNPGLHDDANRPRAGASGRDTRTGAGRCAGGKMVSPLYRGVGCREMRHRGTEGLSPAFQAAHAAFLASGCRIPRRLPAQFRADRHCRYHDPVGAECRPKLGFPGDIPALCLPRAMNRTLMRLKSSTQGWRVDVAAPRQGPGDGALPGLLVHNAAQPAPLPVSRGLEARSREASPGGARSACTPGYRAFGVVLGQEGSRRGVMPTINQLIRQGRVRRSRPGTRFRRSKGEPPEARRLHAGLYDHAEEAELGASQGRKSAPDQRLRSRRATSPAKATTCRSTRWS